VPAAPAVALAQAAAPGLQVVLTAAAATTGFMLQAAAESDQLTLRWLKQQVLAEQRLSSRHKRVRLRIHSRSWLPPTHVLPHDSAHPLGRHRPRTQIPSGQISRIGPAAQMAQGSRPCCAAQTPPGRAGPPGPSSAPAPSAGLQLAAEHGIHQSDSMHRRQRQTG